MGQVYRDENKVLCYQGDGFKIRMHRYSDPQRLNLARNAAIYLGKPDQDNIKRPLNILRDDHVTAIFRGEHAEFEFVDVSKEVYDHLITYTTANMRATGGNRALTSNDFAMPGDRVKNDTAVFSAIQNSMNNYKSLLEQNETKQVARSAMPVAAKMNPFVFQFNFVTLGESIFKQRIWEKGAQANTAKVVEGMFALCQTVDCELWDAFYEYKGTPALSWEQARKRLNKKNVTINDIFTDLQHEFRQGRDGDLTLVEYISTKYGGLKSMW